MELIAKKPFRYRGKRLVKDDTFTADDKWSDLLQRTGQARLAGAEQPRRRGRPKGSTNKPIVTNDTNVAETDLVTKTDDSDQDDQ